MLCFEACHERRQNVQAVGLYHNKNVVSLTNYVIKNVDIIK